MNRFALVCLLTLGLLITANPLPAADAEGNYVVWGQGRASCHSFRKALGSDGESGFRAWLMGYLTAYNAVTPDTFRVSGQRDMDALLDWLDDYCATHQLDSLDRATRFMVEALYPDRQRGHGSNRPAWGRAPARKPESPAPDAQ